MEEVKGIILEAVRRQLQDTEARELIALLQTAVDKNTEDITNMSTAVEEASNKANTAQESATEAKTLATQANTLATTANTTATEAKKLAEEAISSGGGGQATLAYEPLYISVEPYSSKTLSNAQIKQLLGKDKSAIKSGNKFALITGHGVDSYPDANVLMTIKAGANIFTADTKAQSRARISFSYTYNITFNNSTESSTTNFIAMTIPIK